MRVIEEAEVIEVKEDEGEGALVSSCIRPIVEEERGKVAVVVESCEGIAGGFGVEAELTIDGVFIEPANAKEGVCADLEGIVVLEDGLSAHLTIDEATVGGIAEVFKEDLLTAS